LETVLLNYRPPPKGPTSAQRFDDNSQQSAAVSEKTDSLDLSGFRLKHIRGTASDIRIKQLLFPRNKINQFICKKLFREDMKSMETFLREEVIRLNKFRSAYCSLSEEASKKVDEITQFQPFFELYLKNVFEHLKDHGHEHYHAFPVLCDLLSTEISVNSETKKTKPPADLDPAPTAQGSLLPGVSPKLPNLTTTSDPVENINSNSSADPFPAPIDSTKESFVPITAPDRSTIVHLTGHTDLAIHSTPQPPRNSTFSEKLIYADAILELKRGFGGLYRSLSSHPTEQTIGEVMALGDMVKEHLKSPGVVDNRVDGSMKAGLTDLFVMILVVRTGDDQYGITNSVLEPDEYVKALLFLLCRCTSDELKSCFEQMDSGVKYETEDEGDKDDSRGNDSKGNRKDEKKDGGEDDYDDDDNDDGGNPSRKLFLSQNYVEKENLQNMVTTPSLKYEQRQEEDLKKLEYMKAWTEAAGETFLTSEVLVTHQLKLLQDKQHQKKPLGLSARL
jgi:hypothetical protein